jgi:hypothetical protein
MVSLPQVSSANPCMHLSSFLIHTSHSTADLYKLFCFLQCHFTKRNTKCYFGPTYWIARLNPWPYVFLTDQVSNQSINLLLYNMVTIENWRCETNKYMDGACRLTIANVPLQSVKTPRLSFTLQRTSLIAVISCSNTIKYTSQWSRNSGISRNCYVNACRL